VAASRWPGLLVVAAFGTCALASAPAAAEVTLCVEVRAPAADVEGLRTLVRTEVERHPSHVVVEADCASSLHVELFDAAGVRYLTAQIDREIPVRYAVSDPSELADRLAEGLSLVLHNDPVYLAEDITHYSEAERLAHSIGVAGRSTWRVELIQMIAPGGGNAAFATGAGFSMTRGSGNWQVMARVYLGGWAMDPDGTDRTLQVFTGADAGLTYEFLDRASWTPYLSACGGLQFLRYAGREKPGDTGLAFVNQIGVDLSARAGFRFFRLNDFDLDVFVAGYLPLFKTKDVDGALFGDGIYTPSLQIGVGVGF
jgi:hypothetical protein